VKLENEMIVPAPVDQAWDVLLDVGRVAPCLPGAAIESSDGDEHVGTMRVKIGPITASYRGTLRIETADREARRAVMRAQAADAGGQGTAAATITSTMEPVPEGTRVRVQTEMQITGPAAQFGRGVMQDVSAKMMGRFAACLAEEIAGAAAGARAGAAGDGRRAATVADLRLPPGPAGDAAARARPPRTLAEVGREREAAAVRSATRPTADVLDLAEAGREAILKRLLPAAAAAVLLALVAWLVARRRTAG
jgi:carbon monoxide dehydrogenase subunit G